MLMDILHPIWDNDRIMFFARETLEGYGSMAQNLSASALRIMRDEYEINLEALRSELRDTKEKPVEYVGEGLTIRELTLLLKLQTEITQNERELRFLAENRANKRQPFLPIPPANWTTAPAWAMWWAIIPGGVAFWYETEPEIMLTAWQAKSTFQFADIVDLPVGIDWRLTKQARPE